MRQAAFITLTLFLCLALAPALWAQDLTGPYRAEGMNPDGSKYVGSVQIAQQGAAVTMAWQVGASAYSGAGIIDGRVLTVNWGDATPVVYVVMPGGQLYGIWSDGRALERLIPQ